MTAEKSSDIDYTAAGWAARLDRGPLSTEEAHAFDQWLEQDERHLGAYAKAMAVMTHLDRSRALGDSYDPSDFLTEEPEAEASFPRSRRWVLGGGLAVAASAIGAVGISFLRGSETLYSTQRGEVRQVPLADGSFITLDTASKAAVRFSGKTRSIALEDGKVLFEVAHDPSRPFIVESGDVAVRAVGTKFVVDRRDKDLLAVTVTEGIVEVTRPGAAPIRVAAMNCLTVGIEGTAQVKPVDRAFVTGELAWRQGMLSFNNTPLAIAVEQFARYADPAIVVDDPVIGSRTITGVFSATNPQGFARIVAASMDLESYVAEGKIHLRKGLRNTN